MMFDAMDHNVYMKGEAVNKNDALIFRWWDDLKPLNDNEVTKRLNEQNGIYQLYTKPVQPYINEPKTNQLI